MATFASLPAGAQAIVKLIADFLHFPVANFPGSEVGDQGPAPSVASNIEFKAVAGGQPSFSAPFDQVPAPSVPSNTEFKAAGGQPSFSAPVDNPPVSSPVDSGHEFKELLHGAHLDLF